MWFLGLCLTLLHLSAASPFSWSNQSTTDPSVTIASGVLIGTTVAVTNQPNNTGRANAYLSVPFASSPPLRFAPPEPPEPWTTPLKAQMLPPACLQQFGTGASALRNQEYFNNPGGLPPIESEDCLYLNVYTPQDASTTNLKPVMFWIFGGNWQFGTASIGYYNGSSFAVNQDVILVIANYRTNIFGFSSSPEIRFGEQNSGLLDSRLALKWVQENIRAFGGDPDLVTIFGESAGGVSVKQLLANPPSPRGFNAAIMESPFALILQDGKSNFAQVTKFFNCSDASSPTACLREIDGESILTYINDEGLGFPPVDNDGTYSSNVLPSLQDGTFADVPILIGTNKDEANILAGVEGTLNGSAQIEQILRLTGPTNTTFSLLSLIDKNLLNSTLANTLDDEQALEKQLYTDFLYTCTVASLSTVIEEHNKSPIWRYRFDAAFPDVSYFADAGAYHSSEIPSVWGTYALSNQYGTVTPDQIALSKYMQTVWAGMARNRSISAWPALGSLLNEDGREEKVAQLALLGNPAQAMGSDIVGLAEVDASCAILGVVLEAIGLAY